MLNSKNIDKIKTSSYEQLKFAEFGTPFTLRKDMLSILPISFWKNKNRKVLEPCCGKGGFVIDVISLFMKHLDIPDKKKRYKYIVENIVYFADINKRNVNRVCKMLGGECNCWVGDSLEIDFGVKFDLVLGNPPYNTSGQKSSGNTLYQLFIKKALNEWIKPGGYLLFVTPNAWRKPVDEKSRNKGMYELMTKDNWMKYLEIHDILDGMKTFKARTRYDWYLIKKTKPGKTIVLDEKNKKYKMDLRSFPWLPNYDFRFIKKLLAKPGQPRVDIISDANYHPKKDYVSDKKTKKFKYVCVHSTSGEGVKYKYSSKRIGHFKIPKVIFGDSSVKEAIMNKSGKYCLTYHAIGIVDKEKNLEKILGALKTDRMRDVLNACLWSIFQIDWRMFTYFRKDFYRYF